MPDNVCKKNCGTARRLFDPINILDGRGGGAFFTPQVNTGLSAEGRSLPLTRAPLGGQILPSPPDFLDYSKTTANIDDGEYNDGDGGLHYFSIDLMSSLSYRKISRKM